MNTDFFVRRQLRILQLEDNPRDAELVKAILEAEGFTIELVRVETQTRFLAELDGGATIDLIISDFSLPSYDGLAALQLAREKRARVPFIFFSGTIGEEVAIDSLRNGATDYVLKHRPERLVPAVRRAIREQEDRVRRRQAEEQLRRSEQQFRQIAENVDDLIAVLDLEGKRIYNSPSYATVLGNAEALKGTDSFAEIHPEDRERIRQLFHETVRTGVGKRAEFRFLLEDGSVRYIESQGSVIRDGQGNIVNALVVSRDVTKRKRAEEQIREQAALLDKAQDAICVTDMSQRILYWNKSAEVLYGWPAADALGKNANELLFKDDATRPMEALKSLISRREWKGELRQVTRNGKDIIVESRWTLVPDSQGKPKSILVVNTDITEKKRLETQFFRSQRLENIGMLASGIAHDLNNVLAPIMMGVPMLRESLADDASLNILETLERSAKRGADLVSQILSFARGAEGETRQIQLKHLIVDIERLVRETFPKSIHFKKDMPADLWVLQGNATQLHQVLLNLCVNARDAMPAGGTLSVVAQNQRLTREELRGRPDSKPGPYVVITVADTGTGIAPEVLDRIFEPFFTTKEPGKGTGLGLATVQGIVKNHHGFIEVQSEIGKGTQFRIHLPAQERKTSPGADETQPALPPGNGELVLVVDDEAAIRQIARATLESYGYRVITANDGAEAVALYEQKQAEIKAVVLDSMMPLMDGAATARALRDIAPNVRIVGVSGGARGDQAPGDPNIIRVFLTKPYTASQLLVALRTVLTETG
jgi:PAS domain S-box-containing protein